MKRSTKIRERMTAAIAKQNAILDACEANGAVRDRTAEEETAFQAAKADVGKLKGQLDESLELEAAEAIAPAVSSTPANGERPTTRAGAVTDRAEDDPRRGFKSHRDFLMAAMDNSEAGSRGDVEDERLRPLALTDSQTKTKSRGSMAFMLPNAFTPRSLQATVGSDEQGVYSDTYGGFTVPETLLAGMRTTAVEGDPTNTLKIPMQTPVVKILARTDKDHSTSISGGLTVSRRAETGAFAASRMAMERITLDTNTLAGLSYESEELLTDSAMSFVAIIQAGFRDQFATHILKEKIRGTGVGEFLGILSSPALITISKVVGQAVDTINATNVIAMRARCWNYGTAVWIANHDTLPQLLTMQIATGVGGQLMYTPGTATPDNLLGRPIFYSEHASKIGDVGDLILGNWGEYLEGLYQPLQSAESIHVRFLNHERTFKFWLRNAGAPWWRVPLTPAQSTATLSPFVVLEAR